MIDSLPLFTPSMRDNVHEGECLYAGGLVIDNISTMAAVIVGITTDTLMS